MLRRAMAFERWRAQHDSDPTALGALPEQYFAMSVYWPEAFEFYRSHLLEYLERALGLGPWNMTLRSALARAGAGDPKGFTKFDDVAWSAVARFVTQRGNATRRFLAHFDEYSEGNFREALEDLLHAYGLIYETGYVLWYLGVVAKALTAGKFRPHLFGGPETTTAKAALIKDVGSALAGSALDSLFHASYEPGLRNAIYHNSYEILETRRRYLVRDTKTGQEWSPRDVDRLARNSMQLMEAVASSVGYSHEVEVPRRVGEFADAGVVSMNYFVAEDGVPETIMLQLWCFRDIDPRGDWLERAQGGASSAGDLERVHFTDRAFLVGEPVTQTVWGEAVKTHGWVRVHRLPAAPAMYLGHPVFVRPDGGRFEVLGPGDEHMVPFVL